MRARVNEKGTVVWLRISGGSNAAKFSVIYDTPGRKKITFTVGDVDSVSAFFRHLNGNVRHSTWRENVEKCST